MNKARAFLRDLWLLTRPYWFSEERISACLLLAAVLALNLGIVFINVQINIWQNAFYNSLEAKDQAEFMRQLLKFCWLAAVFIVMAVYALYLNQMLQIRWRRWLTEKYLNEWLDGHIYYRLQLTDRGTDNPDQRIAEDLRLFVDSALALTLGFISAVVTLVSFIGILWGLSGPLTVALGGQQWVVPGYLVWAAILYAVVGTAITHKIGRPLIQLNYGQQRFEADLRYSLVRFRENAEGIALYHGEADEKKNFLERFGAVMGNWWEIMKRQKKLTWFTSGYGQLAIIFPVLVVSPRYFSGAIQLGGLMQTSSAFGQVQGALSWFIDAYPRLAEWKATVDRLTGFRRAIERARVDAQENPGILQTSSDTAAITLKGIRLQLPDGRVLLNSVTEQLVHGEPVLVTGPSGSGKSTLFRAIAGIWPFGNGRVGVPGGARLMFLPQKPYLPVGTLRDVMSYPLAGTHFDDSLLRQMLVDCGLPHLIERLPELRSWSLELSGGEQQRIAFCRALLHRPDWLFMDEASSALDEKAGQELYLLLKARLTDTTIVSISHQPGLETLHQRKLELQPAAEGGGVLTSAPIGR